MRFKKYIGIISILLLFGCVLSVISAVDENNDSYTNSDLSDTPVISRGSSKVDDNESQDDGSQDDGSQGDGSQGDGSPLDDTGVPLIGLLIILSVFGLAFNKR
jgi:hypothetical protein